VDELCHYHTAHLLAACVTNHRIMKEHPEAELWYQNYGLSLLGRCLGITTISLARAPIGYYLIGRPQYLFSWGEVVAAAVMVTTTG